MTKLKYTRMEPDDHRNRSIRVPGSHQSNQVGELAATIVAIEVVPHFVPLEIMTDSTYVIKGLTTHLPSWEDQLKRRTATTHFKWVKGHNGNQGNEESDALAKRGAEKEIPDEIDLTIPMEYDLQGAKMSTITQKIAYQGIMKQKPRRDRGPTAANLHRTREALEACCGKLETDETIWKSLRKKCGL